jgi:hypothetical protein
MYRQEDHLNVVDLIRLPRSVWAAFASFILVSACPAAAPKLDQQIATNASKSLCAEYSWKERGVAPTGFIKGIALAHAGAYRDLNQGIDPVASIFNNDSLPKDGDALAIYGKTAGPPVARLRATYALAIGEGMRESSGNFTAGTTVKHQTADTAEAGLFQTSYDSITSSPWLKKLWEKYQQNPSHCLLETFAEGVTQLKTNVVGAGPGADFQQLTKSCPQFATEYAVIMFRVNRNHYGPIKRKEAELIPACESMLAEIEREMDNGR